MMQEQIQNVAQKFVDPQQTKNTNIMTQQLKLMPTRQIAQNIRKISLSRAQVLQQKFDEDKTANINEKIKSILNPLVFYSEDSLINLFNFTKQNYNSLSLMPMICQFYLQQINYFIDIQDQIDPLTGKFITADDGKTLFESVTEILRVNNMADKIQYLFELYYTKETRQNMIRTFYKPLLNKTFEQLKQFKYYVQSAQFLAAIFNVDVALPQKIDQITSFQSSVLQKYRREADVESKMKMEDIIDISNDIILKTLKTKENLKEKAGKQFFTIVREMNDIRTMRQNLYKRQIQDFQKHI